jgi:peroxin-3
MSSSIVSDSSDSRTKAELWNEVKILSTSSNQQLSNSTLISTLTLTAFTRVLTTLYSTTLLSLLTVLQLTLLARYKYIYSIVQLEREEHFQEQLEAQFTMRNILFGGQSRLQALMEEGGMGVDGEQDAQIEGAVPINEEVESRFLTMSWWILHVGWKDVAERVRRGVEEVFDGSVILLFIELELTI